MSTEKSEVPTLTCDEIRDGTLSLASIEGDEVVFRTTRLEGYKYGAFEMEYPDGTSGELDREANKDHPEQPKTNEKVWRFNKDIFIPEDIGSSVKAFYYAAPPDGELTKSSVLTFIVKN
ncbi:hypothetical protein ACYZTR_05160 [Pseudomonas sp. Hz4]